MQFGQYLCAQGAVINFESGTSSKQPTHWLGIVSRRARGLYAVLVGTLTLSGVLRSSRPPLVVLLVLYVLRLAGVLSYSPVFVSVTVLLARWSLMPAESTRVFLSSVL